MEHAVFDTADQPLMRRGGFWLDQVCIPRLGVHGRTYAHQDPRFFGRLTQTIAGDFSATSLACTAGVALRGAAEVRARPLGMSVISIQRGESGIWRQRGQDVAFRRGDVIMTNPDDPYDLAMTGNFDLLSFYVPQAALHDALPRRGAVLRHLPHQGAAAALAAQFGSALVGALTNLDETAAAGMFAAFCQVVSVAAGAAAGAHLPALREARLIAVQRHIQGQLANPGLTPASCARAVGMSVRALHLAFEPSGESFSAFVQRLRLEKCRTMLAAPGAVGRPVADIAFACGFGSLPSFYRAFSGAFGAAPGELKARR